MKRLMTKGWLWVGCVVLGVFFCLPGLALAANVSFTGTFAADDDVQLFDFTVGAFSTVTLVTKSYAGGTLADGTVILAGGFDPILTLFDSTGIFIDDNDDGPLSDVGTDPVTLEQLDAFLRLDLVAGDYTVALSQYDNFSAGDLSDGFDFTGDPFFTAVNGCSNGQFCDDHSSNRTNAWAFDVLNVNSASAVPVPSTVLLFGTGLAGLLGWRLRKTNQG